MSGNRTPELEPRVSAVLDYEAAIIYNRNIGPASDTARERYYDLLLRFSVREFRQWFTQRYSMGQTDTR